MPSAQRPPGGSSRLAWAAGALLVVALAALAALQLRWLRAVADADRQRLASTVENALDAFAADLDREVSRAWLTFRPVPAAAGDERQRIAALAERWRADAPYPRLVGELLLVEAGDGQPRQTLRLDAGGAWEPAKLPRLALPRLRQPRDGEPRRRGRRDPVALPFALLAPELPGLLLPLPGDFREAFGRAPTGEPAAGGAAERWLVVRFDLAFLREELLPALTARYLEPVLGPRLELRITARGGEVVYATAADLHGTFEWQAPLFDLLPAEDLRRLLIDAHRLADDGRRGGEGRSVPPAPPFATGEPDPAGEHDEAMHLRHQRMQGSLAWGRQRPGWRLELRPAGGSLDAALARAHRGNTALAVGILLLLALAAAALALSARRAQGLARRQLEFTAAVSHELRTPLAAIRSLAENLADGVVSSATATREYGAQIAAQGARLSAMVEEVLALATDPRGLPPRERRPVDLAALVGEVVAEARAGYPGAAVEVELPALPLVLGDPAQLRRALGNLLGNALRHGGSPPWAAVRGSLEGGEVRLAVIDRGPGVPDADRTRLFEPFFRGALARAQQVPGAGLGLHLARRAAEAHGGRVELAAAPGGGATFTLVLPAGSEGVG